MKQLNNKITGEIITFHKSSETGIYYTIFENSIFLKDDKFGISKRIDAIDKLTEFAKNLFQNPTISVNEVIELATLIKIIEVEPGYEISEDSQNWYISIGSTGEPTNLRLLIPNKAYDSALRAKNNETDFYYPLWLVIAFGTETIDAKFSQITYNSIVLYLLELLPEHEAILKMYENDGVIIEFKL